MSNLLIGNRRALGAPHSLEGAILGTLMASASTDLLGAFFEHNVGLLASILPRSSPKMRMQSANVSPLVF